MEYCNPPGLNLILPQLAKSSGLHSYQSFILHSSLWSCCPYRDFSGVLWWLESLVLGTVLLLIVTSVVAPSPPAILYFTGRTAAVEIWSFCVVLLVTQSASGWSTHVNETPEIKVMFTKRYSYKFLGHSVLWLLLSPAFRLSSPQWCDR